MLQVPGRRQLSHGQGPGLHQGDLQAIVSKGSRQGTSGYAGTDDRYIKTLRLSH
jgi:hypothetical protein